MKEQCRCCRLKIERAKEEIIEAAKNWMRCRDASNGKGYESVLIDAICKLEELEEKAKETNDTAV